MCRTCTVLEHRDIAREATGAGKSSSPAEIAGDSNCGKSVAASGYGNGGSSKPKEVAGMGNEADMKR